MLLSTGTEREVTKQQTGIGFWLVNQVPRTERILDTMADRQRIETTACARDATPMAGDVDRAVLQYLRFLNRVVGAFRAGELGRHPPALALSIRMSCSRAAKIV
jgi:hypothetical protein